MILYTNPPEKPGKLDLAKIDIATLPKTAMLGNYIPNYLYKEVITRKGKNGKTVELKIEKKFQEANLPLSRMCAFRHALKRAEGFFFMKQLSEKGPVNQSPKRPIYKIQADLSSTHQGESPLFKNKDLFRFEIWIVCGESSDDKMVIWDSENLLASMSGNMTESATLELLLIPGANPAKEDYNLEY